MINTYLPKRMRQEAVRREMNEIFTKIAEKIVKKAPVLQALYQSPDGVEISRTLETAAQYREFLMAPDFYRYRFSASPEVLQNVFSYGSLDPKLRHRILNAMDMTVCPYCNMNYTLKFTDDGSPAGEINTADVDHFYIKSDYPQYALCLYNMIPACPVCNSRMKGAEGMTVEDYVWPHGEGFGSGARFRADNIDRYLLHRDPEVKLALEISPEADPEEARRLGNSRDLFKLNQRYQSVHRRAEELIEKAEIYTEGYSRELEQEFAKVFQGASIREMAFGPEETEEQYAHRSLGKLRMDLLYQTGIYRENK